MRRNQLGTKLGEISLYGTRGQSPRTSNFRKLIEVDRAKIEAIERLPSPNNFKEVGSFIGHAGFYRRLIKYFLKITKPLSNLLIQGTSFDFVEECQKSFSILKEKLVTTPIVVALDWNLHFDLLCDTSNYNVRSFLSQ